MVFRAVAKKPRKAIFLDRDGTLNADLGYVYRKEDWHWLPGVLEALAEFRRHDWALIVVTNQSGIARGYYSEADLASLQCWLNEDLSARGLRIDAWYHCPHLPEITGPCSCRKPAPGLLLKAASDLSLDLGESWMLGDSRRDLEAGLAAGCHTGLICSEQERIASTLLPGALVWPDLFCAARAINAR